MKTTTRLYDIIYSTYNQLYGDFLRGHQIVYFNRNVQFSAKIATYDDEVKNVCRNTIFYGLDFLDETVRERFEAEFIARFLTRTIKFQTWEVLNWKLVAYTRGIKEILTDYYINAEKYLKADNLSESNSESVSRDNSLDLNLAQDQVDMSLDKDDYEYGDSVSHSKSRIQGSNETHTQTFDIGRLKELQNYHEDLFEDLDRKLFSQFR